MFTVCISKPVEPTVSALTSVKVGSEPSGAGTPARFVTIFREGAPILRVALYASDSNECFAFEDAVIWRDALVVGFGNRVHLIALADHSCRSIDLGCYFGHLYPTDQYVLVASAERVFCIGTDWSVRWRSDVVGIDGVVLSTIEGPIVRGEGEWDPPGGWEPFALRTSSGDRLSRER